MCIRDRCKTDKEAYEKYWDDISPFIKFGCLKDEKFCDKINDYILFKDINDKYQTLPELLAPVSDDEKSDSESASASDDTKKADNTDANADLSLIHISSRCLLSQNRILQNRVLPCDLYCLSQ